MPLAIVLGIIACLGLVIALLGHAARSASVAPSMYRNSISPDGYVIFVVFGLLALATAASFGAERVTCKFDRNEPRKGEPGDGLNGKPVEGWWWDVYKCSDGTERRVLVAGPRG